MAKVGADEYFLCVGKSLIKATESSVANTASFSPLASHLAVAASPLALAPSQL